MGSIPFFFCTAFLQDSVYGFWLKHIGGKLKDPDILFPFQTPKVFKFHRLGKLSQVLSQKSPCFALSILYILLIVIPVKLSALNLQPGKNPLFAPV